MKSSYLFILLSVLLMSGCTDTETTSPPSDQTEQVTQQDDTTTQKTDATKDADQQPEKKADTRTTNQPKETNPSTESKTTLKDSFTGYKKIMVDGGDLSGGRQANVVVDRFKNGNPDETNAALGLTQKKETKQETTEKSTPDTTKTEDVSRVDTDANGQVTIQEAKDAGYAMPITEKHWLYQYMRDNDHDGVVGE